MPLQGPTSQTLGQQVLGSVTSYVDFISDKTAFKGVKFGLPIKGCWDFVPEDQKEVTMKIFDGIREAGGEIIEVEYPCAKERILKRGIWDWYVALILDLFGN
jgi:hypothetical protein